MGEQNKVGAILEALMLDGLRKHHATVTTALDERVLSEQAKLSVDVPAPKVKISYLLPEDAMTVGSMDAGSLAAQWLMTSGARHSYGGDK